MPLYDCMLLLKPQITKDAMIDLLRRIGNHVYRTNGVLTDVKSFRKVNLGYGIKKLDGKYFKGQLLQMTMMATPKFNKELQYLNQEDRLLRWLLVKHRTPRPGKSFNEDDGKGEMAKVSSRSSIIFSDEVKMEDDDDDDDEYEVYEEEETQPTHTTQ
ncbi:hypothetical protein Sjap_019538 [Stephania japonica]|uniref:Uncharacterized protein n=1 Tax=Stephania japonica TaxID=461633 RepID=A0AAP0HZT8_9MAGN